MNRLTLAAILVALGCSGRVSAQEGPEHLSPFPNGAGRTYAVTARGLDAVGINPGLLALGTQRHFEISVLPFTSFGANAGPSFKQLNSLTSALSDSTLSDSTRGRLVELFLNNQFSGRVDVRLLGVSYGTPELGTFALTWDMHVGAQALFTDSLLNFFGANAYAYLTQHILNTQTNMDMQGQWYSEYGLSYGRALLGDTHDGYLQLDGGLGIKYVAGIAYTRLDPESFASINVRQAGQQTNIRIKYKLQFAYPDVFDPKHLPNSFTFGMLTSATAGSGFGLDLGFVLHPHADSGAFPWSVALSVADIGSITWTKHTDFRSVDTTVNIDYQTTGNGHINEQSQVLAGKLDTTDAPFTSLLPTTLHVAASVNLAGLGLEIDGIQLIAATEFAKGLTTTVGAPRNGRFGLGLILERPSPNIAFHTAIGMTTQDKITDLTFAIGVGFWNRVLLDLSTNGLGGVLSSTGRSDAALGIKVLF